MACHFIQLLNLIKLMYNHLATQDQQRYEINLIC